MFLIWPFRPDRIILHRGCGNDSTFQHISPIRTWNKVIEIHQICSFKLKYFAYNFFQYIMRCVQITFHIFKKYLPKPEEISKQKNCAQNK